MGPLAGGWELLLSDAGWPWLAMAGHNGWGGLLAGRCGDKIGPCWWWRELASGRLRLASLVVGWGGREGGGEKGLLGKGKVSVEF